jgi:ABC-2 type transport system ATP-binding protein
MKQRLGFAQALIHRPKLLILDEPVSALDPVGRRDVLNLLRELQQETTILFSTHVLHDAEEICDQIIMMRDGRVAIQGQLDDIRDRYNEPVITVVAGNASNPQVKAWMTEISRKPYVLRSELQRESMTLTVSDLELAEREIWKDAMQHRIFIRRFEAGQSTLEDLFLKVVQS